MENLKKITYFNLVNDVNGNFEKIEDAIAVIDEGSLVPQANIANIATTTNITAVPASFADLASVRTYLADAGVISNIEVRLDQIESKVNAVLAALRSAGLLTV